MYSIIKIRSFSGELQFLDCKLRAVNFLDPFVPRSKNILKFYHILFNSDKNIYKIFISLDFSMVKTFSIILSKMSEI